MNDIINKVNHKTTCMKRFLQLSILLLFSITIARAQQFVQQGSKLVGTGVVGLLSRQGISVSISEDGNTAIVGGYNDNSGIGAAWVYIRFGGVWTQQGTKLVGTGAVGSSYQGHSVSLSADGNTAIVGGDGDNSSIGAAWVYTRSGGVWTQQGSKLVGTEAVGQSSQGFSVSLSADGNTAIVGGYHDNNNIVGAAWVFIVAAPTITNFTPVIAATAAIVTITGTNFTGATAISFGGTAATSFTVVNDTTITAVVAAGTSGIVSVTTSGGTASLAGFIYQITYTFNGNGNWSDTANWVNRMVPPTPIPNGTVVNISPGAAGECILNIPVRIPANVNLNVQPGKKIKVLGDMIIHYDSTVVLKDNVHVVDTTILISNSTPLMLGQGIYQYSFSSALPIFNNGDILVGPLNNGYIRKITSSAIAGNTITFQTTQANMEDVFKQGFFNFSLGTDSLLQRPASPTSNTYSYTFNNVTLYQNGPLTIKLNNGNITLNPNWNFDFDFKNLKINNFKMGCENANLTSNFEVNINASQAVTLIDKVDTLKHLSKTYTKWVSVYGIPVPVVIEMNLDFICKYSASIDASISRDIAFNSNNNFSLGINYSNNSWMPIYGFNNTNGVTTNASTGNVNAIINLAIVPTFSFKLYGLVGPYASIGLQEQLKVSVASPSLDWDFSAGVWLKTTLGANANAFGSSLFDYSKFWDTDTFFYKTPYSITKISGDNQTGQANQFLTQPIRVRVLDSKGNPQSNVPVYFTVTVGGGTVQNASVLTDNNGNAETLWKLGSQFGIQYLEIKVKKADGTFMNVIPLVRATTTFTIGQSYQGGQIVYIDSTGQHGLIAANNPISIIGVKWCNCTGGYVTDPNHPSSQIWQVSGAITIGSTSTAIGTGNTNTNAIIAAQGSGNYTAKQCADLILGGYDDWYMPSLDEMNQINIAKTICPCFNQFYLDSEYYTSSESDEQNAWSSHSGGLFRPIPKAGFWIDSTIPFRSF
jgi:hypothetical protein